MATELRHSDFEDPFRDCSLLSLLPQTLGASFHAGTAASEPQELGSIESFFKSMALKGSTWLLEQARTISKTSSDIQSLYTGVGDKALTSNGEELPQGRRPALGRRRARFSLKPTSNHVPQNVEFSSSIDHIEDPEEYFLAFEQLENAERELKKLRGENCTTLTHHHQSTTARKRRPGLLGKTASYKHLFPANADSSGAFVESQESLGTRISSPPRTSTEAELSNVLHSGGIDEPGTSQDKKTNNELLDATDKEGSVADKERKIGNLLGQLLSSFKDLEGGDGRTLLEERLQIKQIDVGKICLPELGSSQRISGSVFNNKMRGGMLQGSQSRHNSSSLPRSPLAAISTLQRRISLKDPLKDVYSLPSGVDSSYSRDSSLREGGDSDSISLRDKNDNDKSCPIGDRAASTVVESGKQLNFDEEMHSPILEADKTTGSKITTEEDLTEHLPCAVEKNKIYNSNKVYTSKEVETSEPNGELLEAAPCSRDSSQSKGRERDSHVPTDTEENDKYSLIGNTASSVETGKPLSSGVKMHSPVLEESRTTGSKNAAEEKLTENPSLLENYMDHISDGVDNIKDVTYGLDGNLQDEGRVMQLEPLITSQPGAAVEDPTSGSINRSRAEGFTSPPSRNSGPYHSTSGTNMDANLFGLDDTLQSEVNAMRQEQETNAEASRGGSGTPKATIPVDGHLENTSVLPDEANEGHQTASGVSLNRRKQKAPPRMRNKKKDISRRQSLAGAGMQWTSGVRRSSRIRSRPLQYWLGERFLYGRIHDSLATVIGLKYASPAKGGKDPVLKVKSYVPEEYSDLVAQAGLH